jgi:hypothetical protein
MLTVNVVSGTNPSGVTFVTGNPTGNSTGTNNPNNPSNSSTNSNAGYVGEGDLIAADTFPFATIIGAIHTPKASGDDNSSTFTSVTSNTNSAGNPNAPAVSASNPNSNMANAGNPNSNTSTTTQPLDFSGWVSAGDLVALETTTISSPSAVNDTLPAPTSNGITLPATTPLNPGVLGAVGAAILAIAGLGTAVTGLTRSNSAIAKREELEDEWKKAIDKVIADMNQQDQKAEQNWDANQQKQKDAKKIIEVPETISDARKAFDYLQAKFIAEWQAWRKGVDAKWEADKTAKQNQPAGQPPTSQRDSNVAARRQLLRAELEKALSNPKLSDSQRQLILDALEKGGEYSMTKALEKLSLLDAFLISRGLPPRDTSKRVPSRKDRSNRSSQKDLSDRVPSKKDDDNRSPKKDPPKKDINYRVVNSGNRRLYGVNPTTNSRSSSRRWFQNSENQQNIFVPGLFQWLNDNFSLSFELTDGTVVSLNSWLQIEALESWNIPPSELPRGVLFLINSNSFRVRLDSYAYNNIATVLNRDIARATAIASVVYGTTGIALIDGAFVLEGSSVFGIGVGINKVTGGTWGSSVLVGILGNSVVTLTKMVFKGGENPEATMQESVFSLLKLSENITLPHVYNFPEFGSLFPGNPAFATLPSASAYDYGVVYRELRNIEDTIDSQIGEISADSNLSNIQLHSVVLYNEDGKNYVKLIYTASSNDGFVTFTDYAPIEVSVFTARELSIVLNNSRVTVP